MQKPITIDQSLVLKWQRDHEDGQQLTPTALCLLGSFRPALRSDLLIGWIPIKVMAVCDKSGNRDN